MKSLFAVPLIGLSLPEKLDKPIVMPNIGEMWTDDQVLLTNNPADLDEIMSHLDPEDERCERRNELMRLIESYCAIYVQDSALFESASDSLGQKQLMALMLAHPFFKLTELLLWSIKDNWVYAGAARLFMPNDIYLEWGAHHRSTDSTGLWTEPNEFNVSDLNSFVKLLNGELWKDCRHVASITAGADVRCMTRTLSLRGVPRTVRCLGFLDQARSMIEVGLKLTLYVTCLETLFSTDALELSNKLAQRVAFFVGGNSIERQDIFKIMKNIYAGRSKVIHGDAVNEAIKILEASQNADQLLRRVLNKIYSHAENKSLFESNNEDFNNYFDDLILSGDIAAFE